MAELDPRTALEQARAMKRYVESFNGQKWSPTLDSVDRQNLATALDNLLETAAMLLNMADRVAHHPSAPAGQAEGQQAPAVRFTTTDGWLTADVQQAPVQPADDFSGVDPVLMQHYVRHGIAPAHQPAAQSPVTDAQIEAIGAKIYGTCFTPADRQFAMEVLALASSAQAGDRKPLTREQIDKIWHGMGSFTSNDHRIFARAIEAAHGIATQPLEGK